MIDEVSHDHGFTEAARKLIAIHLCNRNGNIGADGILFFVPSQKGDAMMRMFNPDGSEAEMCGNGIRCIGRLAHEVLGKSDFYIETMKGCYAMKEEQPLMEGIPTYSVAIDTVSLHPSELPLKTPHYPHIDLPIPKISHHHHFTALSLSNPHAIVVVDKVKQEELEEVGYTANHTPTVFPKGVNITFCQVLNRQSIYTGTYERGAGITFSCGTGMSAATLACCLNNLAPFNQWIDVYNAGGMVRCKGEQDASGRLIVHLLGNATYTYTAGVSMDFEKPQAFKVMNKVDLPEETIAYEALKERAVRSLAS